MIDDGRFLALLALAGVVGARGIRGSRGVVRAARRVARPPWMEVLPDETELVVTRDKWSAPSVEFRHLDGRTIGTLGSWGGKRDPENPTLDFDPEYQVSQQDRDAMVALYEQHLRWFLEDENAWLMALEEARSWK